MPRYRFKVDAAHHRPRQQRMIGHLTDEIERLVGDEDDVIVAPDGAEQRRIILLALARVGPGLEMLVGDDFGAEFLRRTCERLHGLGVGGQRPLEHQNVAPFPRRKILHQRVHAHGKARNHMHELARAQVAAQAVIRRRDVEQQRVAPLYGRSQRLERLSRRIDQEEVDAPAVQRLRHRRRDVGGRLHGDAFERKLGIEHPHQRGGLIDADLRTGERVFAGLEDEALIGAYGFVARIALDLHVANGNMLAGWGGGWRGLCQGGYGEDEKSQEDTERRVGKGGPDAASKAPRWSRRAHAVRPHSVGTAERTPCPYAGALAAFVHPTGPSFSHRLPRPMECGPPESKSWPCGSADR